MYRRTIPGWAAAALAALIAVGQARAQILQPGDTAPDFHKTDLKGRLQTLSQYRGKVVFLFVLGYS